MSRLTFYRYAVPMTLRNWWLRSQVLGISALRIVKGLLVGRWPWEVVREIREERRRVRAAMEPMWKTIEDAVLHREKVDRAPRPTETP